MVVYVLVMVLCVRFLRCFDVLQEKCVGAGNGDLRSFMTFVTNTGEE